MPRKALVELGRMKSTDENDVIEVCILDVLDDRGDVVVEGDLF